MDALYLPPNIQVDLTTSICGVPVRPTTKSLCSLAFVYLGESSLLGQGKMDALYFPPSIQLGLSGHLSLVSWWFSASIIA